MTAGFLACYFPRLPFRHRVSHQIQRYLLSSLARCAGDTTVRLMAHRLLRAVGRGAHGRPGHHHAGTRDRARTRRGRHARAVPHPAAGDPAVPLGSGAARRPRSLIHRARPRLGDLSEPESRWVVAGHGKAEFVVVANRLPVDLERGPDGSDNWKRSPGGLVTALEPILRSRRGAWVGWPGLADATGRPVRGRRPGAGPGGPHGRGRRGLLRGLLQRHALAALPRRGRAAGVPPALVGGLRAGQPRGSPSGRRRGRGRGRDGLGAGLPAAAGARRCSASCGPDLRIGFFLHIPFPPVRAVPAAAVARADPRGPARRRPGRLPARRRRAQLPARCRPPRRGGHAAHGDVD